MLRLDHVTLARGANRLLEDASLTVHVGHKVGIVGPNGCGKSTLFALLRGELHPESGDVAMPPRWTIAHVAQETPAVEAPGDRVRDGRRRRAPRGRARAAGGRAGPRGRRACGRRTCHCRAAPPPRGHRRLCGARACRDAARGAGLCGRAAHGPRGELLRRLAHAPEPRAGADGPLGPAAPRRADQPPRPGRGDVARGVARALSGDAAPHHARPRLPRPRRRRHRALRRPAPEELRGQLQRLRARACGRALRCSRPPTRSSSARSPT